jgi:hypothetical protein
MKKTIIFFTFIITGIVVSAQNRISLYESFAGESCGPCYTTDPVVDATLLNNASIVIPIRWQVPIISAPSTTWSIYQTDKAEINWRYRSSTGSTLAALPSTLAYGYPSQNTPTDVATNGINTAPTGRIDGQHQWAFGAASDDPLALTNTVISSAQTQTTNFRLAMTPSWSPTFTNCIVTVTVEAINSFTALGNFMFRLCLIERTVNFPTPPGINGQKIFNDVVRRSYPTTVVSGSVTAMGTTLFNVWAPTQTQIFTVSCNIPTYIRDLSQMAFVGFIQDDGDRKVYQASRTPQPAIPNDMKLVSLDIPLSCSGTFSPSFVAQNLGTVAVTALTVAPYIDGVAQPTFVYNGTIPNASTATVTLPTYTAAYGNHTFSMTITGVSGGDINPVNNTMRKVFGISNVITASVSEAFSSFPPTNWYVLNYNFTAGTWVYGSPGGFGFGPGSAKFDFYNNYEAGDSDDLYFPPVNLTGVSNPMLSFDVAYAQYTTQNDKLEVMVSTNCGASWTTVYSKQGSLLSTAPSNSVGPFTPNATQWRSEAINLPSLANQSNVIAKFVATADFGNNLYIDNVNFGQPTLIKTVNSSIVACKVFPNPTSDLANISISLSENERVGVTVINNIGQLIYSSKNNDLHAGANMISLNTESWPGGVYFINVATPRVSTHTKLSVVR